MRYECTFYGYHDGIQFLQRSGDEESWIRSVVKGVQWRHNKTDVTSSGGVQTESKVESITVDFQRGYGNKPYLEPQKFRKLPAEEAVGYWTLDVQTDQDKLVLGESEKEIGEHYRLTDLKEDFQYAVTVTEVSDNRGRPRLKNIKVVGR